MHVPCRKMARKKVVVNAKPGTVSTGGLRYKMNKTPKSLINPKTAKPGPEKKNVDITSTNTVVFGQTTAQVLTLNPIQPGNGSNNRVGRGVQLQSISWRWQGVLAGTTTGATPLRMLLVYDHQNNGQAVAATDILTVDSITSPMNLANNKRFLVIADEEIDCVGTQGPQSWNSKGFRKLNLPMEFNSGVSNSITDIQTGAIIALFYSAGTLLVASPSNQFYSRVRYVDN